jgi:hypothetical protein
LSSFDHDVVDLVSVRASVSPLSFRAFVSASLMSLALVTASLSIPVLHV